MIDDCFKLLRKNFRTNGKIICDHIKRNHFEPGNIAGEEDVCSFCGSEHGLTKEHVIPKWSFQNDPKRYFTTKINDTSQLFVKTTIPACSVCNNSTLSKVENYMINLFEKLNLETDYFNYEDSLNLIRWLEVIDYKFHVLNFRRKFIRKQSDEYIPFLKDIPISVMRMNIELSPYKALAQLRQSQARVKRKEKDSRYYSLVIYKSKNKQSLFFHTMDEYIYFELPEYSMALFYFFKEEFTSNYDAEKKARKIIKENYG